MSGPGMSVLPMTISLPIDGTMESSQAPETYRFTGKPYNSATDLYFVACTIRVTTNIGRFRTSKLSPE